MLNMIELMPLTSQTLAKSATCSVFKEDALHNACYGNFDGFLSQQIKLILKKHCNSLKLRKACQSNWIMLF